jgi:hypothetical protein
MIFGQQQHFCHAIISLSIIYATDHGKEMIKIKILIEKIGFSIYLYIFFRLFNDIDKKTKKFA